MKYLFLIIGLIITIYAGRNLGLYLGDYDILSQYGKGFVFGQVLLFLLGLGLTTMGWLRIRRGNR